ncbi:MAG: YggS family pyridoxal phosphate-dependent enzyme [Clostridia bacterium]
MEKCAYNDVMNNIKQVCNQTNRRFEDITVIAATKMQNVDVLNEFKQNGLIFGENRVQELIDKYPYIDGVNWHFIGQLQTNKVKYIIDKVELIHSVDRIELATEINKQANKIGKIQNVLLEVNIGGEESKGGVNSENIDKLIEQILLYKNVKICGLMTVMPLIEIDFNPYEKMRKLYDDKKKTYKEADWKYLSMGMSADYIEAIKYGSNMIRLGSVLFGERNR